MPSRDWFEFIRASVLELARTERAIEELEAMAAPKAQQYGSIGHGSGGNESSALYRLIEVRAKYEKRRMVTERLLEIASTVLYGPDGRGGLAKELGSTDADCVMGYYLLGMTWRQVADELVRPESVDGPQWCKRRSYRAFEWMDAHR